MPSPTLLVSTIQRLVKVMIDWDELVRREGPAVWRTAYRLVRNQADADECFQETFLSALEASNRQVVRSWPALLKRLAVGRAVDRVRKRFRRVRQVDAADIESVATTGPNPAQQAESAELSAALRWAIGQLPTRQAEAFCLQELEDWSYQEIADHLGLSANAVGVLLHRTRLKLQELLKMQNVLSAALRIQRRT